MSYKGTKTLEQINRIKRQHPKMKTLTSQELEEKVQQLIEKPYSPANLQMIFNTIKTLKAKETLTLLLNHPHPEINKKAHNLSKIDCFKPKNQELNLVSNNLLDTQKIFAAATEKNQYDIIYQHAHEIDFNEITFERKLLHNKKYIKSKLEPFIIEDLKLYQQNCIDVSNGEADINTCVISRLQFAYSLFEYCKIDFIQMTLPYLFDLYVLIIPEYYTVKQKIAALKLEQDGKISHKNFFKNKEQSIGYNLYQQDNLDQILLFHQHSIPSFTDNQLQSQIKNLLQDCELIEQYKLDEIDPEILSFEQLQYYTYKNKMSYVEAVQFIEYKQQEIQMLKSQGKNNNDQPDFSVETLDLSSVFTIKQIRKFLEANPDYVCVSSQPQHQILQTKPPAEGSYLQKYINIDEPAEEVFEKHMLNNQSRFLQSAKRFQALNSLILGALVHKKLQVIPKVIRYTLVAAEKTQNQRELNQLLEVINPSRLLPLILTCLIEELVKFELPEYITQIAKAYITMPSMVQKMLGQFNETLYQLVSSITNYESNFDNCFHMAIDAASYLQYNIPLIKYEIRNIYLSVPQQAKEMMRRDFSQTFYQTDKGIKYGNIADKYKDIAKSEQEFYELLTEDVSKPASYCYSYINSIVDKLSKTQKHFLHLNNIVHKAKDSKDEAQIKKVQREYLYISAYKNIIQAFKCDVTYSEMNQIQTNDKKKAKIYSKYNELIEKINKDFRIFSSAIQMLGMIVNQVFSQSINLNILMMFSNNNIVCSNVKITQWTLQCFEVLSNYINSQYQLYYDKATLLSRFTVNNIINLHQDVLFIVGSSLKEICSQADRFEKAKGIIEVFVKIQENLSLCQLDLASEYQQYYTNYSGLEGQKKAKRIQEQKASKLYKQLQNFDQSFKMLSKSLCASDMIIIAGLLFKVKPFAVMISDVLGNLERQFHLDKNVQFTQLLDQHIPMSSLMSLIKITVKSSSIKQEQLIKLYNKGSVDVKICILQNYIQQTDKECSIDEKLQFVKNHCLNDISVIQGALQNIYLDSAHTEICEQILDVVAPTLKEQKLSLHILQIFNICGFFQKKMPVYELQEVMGMLKTQKLQLEMQFLYIVPYLYHSYQESAQEITNMLIELFIGQVERRSNSQEVENLYNSTIEYLGTRLSGEVQYGIQLDLYCRLAESLFGTTLCCRHETFSVIPQYMDARGTDRLIAAVCGQGYQFLSDQVAQQLSRLPDLAPFTRGFLDITLGNGISSATLSHFSGVEKAILQHYATAIFKDFITHE